MPATLTIPAATRKAFGEAKLATDTLEDEWPDPQDGVIESALLHLEEAQHALFAIQVMRKCNVTEMPMPERMDPTCPESP